MKAIASVAAIAAFCACAHAQEATPQAPAKPRDSEVAVGSLGMRLTDATFSVKVIRGQKVATVFVHDERMINTNVIFLGKQDLLRMKTLIDETIDELDRNPAPAAQTFTKPR